ncbi:SEC-C motif-containing protein [Noviherbaspirillum humi]|uniref:SEC-C motif-containing protein n=1 Tax=Noviherbaspirillum humi TaxID=1688639 RepID=A0A239ILU0_9BURK|nr:SEC-C metal-binding domain-containing protein [Noviherbaspirillum humi]SNS94519.1 SEC-C motif-containing protein [Noviherbaspirillum humi]
MKPGRNDPCPCGSGKKFKKCCGEIIALTPVAAAPAMQRPRQARACGDCTACCDGWVAGTIHGHEMKPGVRCHFVTDGGCSIYDTRPESPCRNFICGWAIEGSPFPESFSPPQTGVIIVPVRWRDRTAFLLKSAGRDPDAGLLNWMADYSRRTGHPFFYEEKGEKLGFGPPEFQLDMLQRARRGEPMW